MPHPYEGNEPYIFISYSHKDSELVLTAIEALEKQGFLVWFDGGIEAGSEWPEYIATHLKACCCMISFISKNFVASKNCQRELVFAQNLDKPHLNVFIEDVELTDGMKLQLGLNQAIWGKNFSNISQLTDAICRAKLLEGCKKGSTAQNFSDSSAQFKEPTAYDSQNQAYNQQSNTAYTQNNAYNPNNGYYQNPGAQANYQNNPNYGAYNGYTAPIYQKPQKLKDKPITLVLCLLLGIFGAHKFYEGKFLMGILYLFTMGLFFVGVIYDLVELFHLPSQYYPKRKRFNWL